MSLVVQKYGGTSVGSVERIQAVAQRAIKTAQTGNSLVVVVSAMGKTTDTLVKLAHEISSNPSRREMDMLLSTGEQVSIALLAMALCERGIPAKSFTGSQIRVRTTNAHRRARITEVETKRLREALEAGNASQAGEVFKVVEREIRRAASRGVIPKRRADRSVGRLAKRLNALG